MSQLNPLLHRCGDVPLHGNTVVLRDAKTNKWRKLSNPRRIVTTTRISEVVSCLREIEDLVLGQGRIAAGFVAYEAASAFDASLAHHEVSEFPLLWFALYDNWSEFHIKDPVGTMPELSWEASVSQGEYEQCLQRIHNFISAGDTYQVNYSYRIRAPYGGDALSLFTHLASWHNPEYGAYLQAGNWDIVSLSPELFFSRNGDQLTSIPMKGTSARGLGVEDDRNQQTGLQESVKNRAENVMIVDMVRNDLGRVAQPGTVQVEELFATRRYPTLWQMTSTVTGRVRASLAEIFASLFPAASITGAPKARTMELIKGLENTPRRIYTGSIGFLLPNGRAQFNVAIRTLLHDRRSGLLEYGVGGGIVADSSIEEEWVETRIKSLTCKPPWPEFSLLETMLWLQDSGIVLLEEHLDRLRDSAEYFDYTYDENLIRQMLMETAQKLSGPGCKLRMLLDCRGKVRIESGPLPAAGENTRLRLVLADSPVDRNNPFLYHKTTFRSVYEQARAAAPQGIDDVLLYNQHGELTETTIANIVVSLDGSRYTPPIRCGLLGGTLRKNLLENGEIEERILSINCLRHAESITLINSVRGQVPAVLVKNSEA